MAKQAKTVRGTIAQLIGRVTINGNTVGQAELSVLTRLGAGTFAHVVEKIAQTDANGKPIKGRPTTVWEIDENINMKFIDDPEAVAAARLQEAARMEDEAREAAARAMAHAQAMVDAANAAAAEAANVAAAAQAKLAATIQG